MQADADPGTILREGDPRRKAAEARRFRQGVLCGANVHCSAPPDRPARPAKPDLVPARQLKRRRLGTPEGRAALLHAIAHIELNAIDLAADMIARFADAPEFRSVRDEFLRDWSSVCDDEARHFVMVADRLDELGHPYGDFPAHGGLWDAALRTREDVAARLAVAPLVLEARGLDVTPGMIAKLDQAGDMQSAAILRIIYEEEIGHVAIGMKWLRHVSGIRNQDPAKLFRGMILEYYDGVIPPPLNHDARTKAGFERGFYDDLVSQHGI
ncbi:MAG: ferritin-like domain-containing protein [Pseudomonadota bacterium]